MTGKTKEINLGNRTLLFHNQRCKEWTHPYPYQGEGKSGQFRVRLSPCATRPQWLTGAAPMQEALADFSVREGGRGDDGTDRPALLQALMLREKSPLGFLLCRGRIAE